jgi:hypothetical protein
MVVLLFGSTFGGGSTLAYSCTCRAFSCQYECLAVHMSEEPPHGGDMGVHTSLWQPTHLFVGLLLLLPRPAAGRCWACLALWDKNPEQLAWQQQQQWVAAAAARANGMSASGISQLDAGQSRK